MKTINIKLPTIEDIDFTIECLEELEHPNDCFALDIESQEEIVNSIIEDLNSGNEWAWCCVRVIGTYKGIVANDYLGGCSYPSEEHFRTCDYYEDMKQTVFNQIIEQLEALQ